MCRWRQVLPFIVFSPSSIGLEPEVGLICKVWPSLPAGRQAASAFADSDSRLNQNEENRPARMTEVIQSGGGPYKSDQPRAKFH